MTETKHRRLIRGAILALAIVGGLLLAFGIRAFPPSEQSFYPRCQLHSLTGLHCPGCGTTRAVHSLLNADVEQAIAFNSLALIIVPVLTLAIVRSLWSWVWELPIRPYRPGPKWVTIILVVAVVAFGVTRNLPWYPFTLLAPHELSPHGVVNDP